MCKLVSEAKMREINCETSNCEHNLKCKCLAGVISVGENAKCTSRIKRDGGPLAQSFADIEASDDLFEEEKLESLVQCSAPCCFNNGGVCAHTAIDVRDSLFSAKCKSFVKK